jgi:hypothetical protein
VLLPRRSAEKLADVWAGVLSSSAEGVIDDVEWWMKKCVLENLLGSGFNMPTDVMGNDDNPLLHVRLCVCGGREGGCAR